MTFKFEVEDGAFGALKLAILVGGEVVWPHPSYEVETAEFDPADILSYLADAWQPMLLEQTWPLLFEPEEEPRSLTGLLRAAEQRWEERGDSAEEGDAVDRFLYHHDLGQMKFGANLPACFVLRHGRHLRMETHGQIYEHVDFSQFLAQLEQLGARCRGLVAKTDDMQTLRRWDARGEMNPASAAGLLSGLSLREVEKEPELVEIFRKTIGNRAPGYVANDNANPVYAAARSSAPLGAATVLEVLRIVEGLPRGDFGKLSNERRAVRNALRECRGAREQGIRAARVIRDRFRYDRYQPIDLRELVGKLGVWVDRRPLSDARLDGIAVAGRDHGPAIILNPKTLRRGRGTGDLERSLHFTLAHELGHLLLDQEEWPALVDAERQRVPRSVETRANAFATRLLLPDETARHIWDDSGNPVDWRKLQPMVKRLSEEFCLPFIAAARQVARASGDREQQLRDIFQRHISSFDGE